MRSLWKGAITFGLVNIPVNLYTATHERDLKFVLLHKKDLSEIRYARICKTEDKEVPYDEIVKGFEISKGDYVVMTDEDFKQANVGKSNAIEILEFIKETDVDSIYYDKPYYLEPGKNAARAYILLRDALKKSKKVALARYVFKNHEHIAVITPHENLLLLNQMRFHNEIVQPKELEIPQQKVPEKEMEMAMKLIEQLSGAFAPEKYKDTYVEDLKKLIKTKSHGGKVVKKGKGEPKPSKVHDIMSLLKASLDQKETPKKRKKAV